MGQPWILVLNDMRSSNIERGTLAVVANSREEIEAILERERVEPYRDGRWGKSFRAGGPLEWFNPPSDSFGHIPRPARPEEVASDYIAELESAAVCQWRP